MEKLEQLISRARELALAENWGQEAININVKILELDPKVGEAYTRLARCFDEQENLLGAREMYLQVLNFEPQNKIALNGLSRIEQKLKYIDDKQLVINVNSYEEAFAIGVAARRKNDITLAIAALKRATELNPTMYSLNALAGAYRANNDLSIAEKIYNDILSRNNNPASLVGLAAVYRDKGLLRQAQKLCNDVLSQNDKDVYALNCLGAICFDLGQLDIAEDCSTKALKIGEAPDESIRNLKMIKQKYVAQNDNDGVRRINDILTRFGY